MPTPVAHSLIGVIVGLSAYLPRCRNWPQLGRRLWQRRALIAVCVILANAPDVDYFFGLPGGNFNRFHQLITHTLGWTLLVAAAVWIILRLRRRHRKLRLPFCLIFALLFSHVLADYFGTDNMPPRGVMLFWPLDERFYISPWPIFLCPYKISIKALFCRHNLLVALYELALLGPLCWLVAYLKIKRKPSAFSIGRDCCPGQVEQNFPD